MKTIVYKLWIIGAIVCLASCSEFLDSKPDKSLVVPSTLADFQGLLDAELRGMNSYPLNGFVSGDDHVFGNGILQRLPFSLQAHYFWEETLYLPDDNDVNWSYPYQKIFYANVVLDGLKDYDAVSPAEVEQVRGLGAAAKFYRAMGHFEVLMHFSEPYNPDGGDQLGIPIRTSSDINIKEKRSTIRECFSQIVADLEDGLEFLPDRSDIPTRPSKWASYAFLSRIFLSMHRYEESFEYSIKALELGDALMDYKNLDEALANPFPLFNQEVIFYQRHINTTYTTNAETFVNPDLVALYEPTDLRTFLFFKKATAPNRFNFKGNYTGDFYHFGGLATDEVLLNLAESAARIGKEEESLDALNYLLKNRHIVDFEPLADLTGEMLLRKILEERRKELLFRGITWLDLKRLNRYTDFARSLERNYNTEGGDLPPNDARYALLIPPLEMNLNPMPQNNR